MVYPYKKSNFEVLNFGGFDTSRDGEENSKTKTITTTSTATSTTASRALLLPSVVPTAFTTTNTSLADTSQLSQPWVLRVPQPTATLLPNSPPPSHTNTRPATTNPILEPTNKTTTKPNA